MNAPGIDRSGSFVVPMVCIALASSNLPTRHATAAEVTFIGAPSGYSSRVEALSFDASHASGFSEAAQPPTIGLLWSQGGGRRDVPENGSSIRLWALSADGTTASGSGRFSGVAAGNPFRVHSGGSILDLGRPSGVRGYAVSESIDADGSTIVGYFQDTMTRTAFRWTPETGCIVLASRNDGRTPTGVSADGRTVVGWSGYNSSLTTAFVWREGMGVTQLARPTEYPSLSLYAHAVSGDGRVIVGSAEALDYNANSAVRWVDGVPERIPAPDGWIVLGGTAVDHDGDTMIVTGRRIGTTPFDPSVALIKSAEFGYMEAREFLVTHGANLPENAQITLTSLSGDGRSFGGMYFDPDMSSYGQGFVFTVPAPHVVVPLLALCVRRRRPDFHSA